MDKTNKKSEIGSNQKLKLFKRAKDISFEFTIKGISHFPNPPIKIGITKKKIIIKPCAVITILNILELNTPPG